jgi:CTP synthase (UTP-ammonia lyase)
MPSQVTILIVGDHDPSAFTHRATDASLAHVRRTLGIPLDHRWVPTPAVAARPAAELAGATGIWIAPGSPYASMEGALTAIRTAREEGIPLIGTCGGFQHVVLEYARNVLGVAGAQHAEYDPNASSLFVTPLSCSLRGQPMQVLIEPGTRAAAAYGAAAVEERYYCSFGLNPDRQGELHERGLRVAAVDADGEARIMEIPEHPFFIATLFVPQAGSTPERPHPLVLAFAQAAAERAALPPCDPPEGRRGGMSSSLSLSSAP